mgnify:FL=1|tara:strand:+ start:198 stop:380 length:183 start_codon:yes stop_codon:yes gene_type:complete
MSRAGASRRFTGIETFTNSLGIWEINEDGTVRLISEAEVPIEKSKRVKKNAGINKRNRVR